jgi:hypothetical protein
MRRPCRLQTFECASRGVCATYAYHLLLSLPTVAAASLPPDYGAMRHGRNWRHRGGEDEEGGKGDAGGGVRG